ncbi:unnamed protein product [Albugo candida]|nr:unnamed protein product [Albugo candida]|eukprot:CCI45317.1 unnamed protein product [Albugo candida]
MYISTNKFDRITEEGEDLSRLFKKNIHLNEGHKLRSLRLPVRALPYILSMNQAPSGKRNQKRWANDYHIENSEMLGNNVEELMQHLHIQVNWRSNFQQLAKDRALQDAFLEAKVHPKPISTNCRNKKTGYWNEAEYMFRRMDRRARALLSKSIISFGSFLEAMEHTILHFVKWREAPSDLELMPALRKMLISPLEITESAFSVRSLRLSLPNSPFHRLLVHALCQFYGLQSKTEQNQEKSFKTIVVLQPQTEKMEKLNCTAISLCRFLLETRVPHHENNKEDSMEVSTRTSECSDGYCVMEFPET